MLKSVEQPVDNSLAEERVDQRPKQNRSLLVTSIRAFVQIALMIGVIAGAIVVMNNLIAAKPERSGRPQFDVVLPVQAADVTLADQRPLVRLFGEIVAARSIDIRASVAGEVMSVNPDLSTGSFVEQGEELFTIDRFDFESALAEAEADLKQTDAAIAENNATIALEKTQLAFAQTQLEFARSDLQRATQLRQRGTLTQKDVDDRELVVSQRDQTVDQRLNNIAIAEARLAQQLAGRQRLELALQRAERDLTNTVVTAPFPGIVRTSTVEIGRIVSSNDVTVSMYDDNALDVRFTLTDAQYGRIATDGDPLVGREVDLIWTVGGIDYDYTGLVSRIGADIASERGGVDVFARLAVDENVPVQLRPGAFVEVAVPDRLYPNAARVPETAIFDGNTVYKIVEGQLRAQKIQLAAYDGADAIVIEGLSQGDQILATRISEIEEGLKVRLVDANGVADPNAEQPSTPARGGPPSAETIAEAKKLSGLSDAEWDALPRQERRPFIQQAREAGVN
ncbi:MAG: HlyD family efflux transporter periplasmic adaptor subunit [Pseudomonadota bacterium]